MKYVGKGIAKTDAIAITTGKPVYTDDLVPDNALIIKLLRSPHAFAEILEIDTSAAEALDGVAGVWTYKNTPQIRYTLAGQTYPEASPYDKVMFDKLVRYMGDEVAMVAARDERTANAALKLIKVTYNVLEPVIDMETALDHPSVIHPESDLKYNFPMGGDPKRNLCASYEHSIGRDVNEVLKECDVVVEGTYYSQAQAQAMMETFRSFSYLDHMNRLVCVSSTQVPFHVKRQIAAMLGIPGSRVRVIKPRIGGGFGAKQTGCTEVYSSFVALETGKPAYLKYDRHETFNSSNSRHAMKFKVRMGATKDGIIKAVDFEGLSDAGAHGYHAFTTFTAGSEKCLPMYGKLEGARFGGHIVYTNKMPGGALRGYGATQTTWAQESVLNLLAAKMGWDAAEIRLKNLIEEGATSIYYHSHPLGSSKLHDCIRTGKAMIGWDEKAKRIDLGDKIRALGMAVTMQGSGIAKVDTANAVVRFNDDGNYTLFIGSTDMGTGSDTILAQMAAEILDCDMSKITVNAADTDISPFDPGSYASSTTYVTGMAVVRASEDLKRKLIEYAARQLHTEPDRVDFDGETFRFEDKSINLRSLGDITTHGLEAAILEGTGNYGSPISPPPYVAGFAEIEIDKATGKVDMVQYVAAVDCGTVINPLLARVQVEGGIVQSIGMALFEDVRYTAKGKMETNSFMTYKIPTRLDAGIVRVAFEESHEPTGPFGAKSVGEVVNNTPSPAISNAIQNATGVQLTRLPFTPEKVLYALKYGKEME